MILISNRAGRRIGFFTSIVTLCFLLSPALHASTIVSVTSASNSRAGYSVSRNPVFGSQLLASSWISEDAWADVSIAAVLSSNAVLGQPPGNAGTAWLMTRIGPGTTALDQVAMSEFSFPPAPQPVSLFSNLTLGPGTYYLVVSAAPGFNEGIWQEAYGCNDCIVTPPVIQTAARVTRNPDFIAHAEYTFAYGPAGDFELDKGLRGDPFVKYTVTGTLLTEIPEPGSYSSVCVGMAVLILLTLKKTKAQSLRGR